MFLEIPQTRGDILNPVIGMECVMVWNKGQDKHAGATTTCEWCGAISPYPRVLSSGAKDYKKRRFCSNACSKLASHAAGDYKDRVIPNKGQRGDLAERLRQYSTPEPTSGCWIWSGKVSKSGYAYISAGGNGNSRRAARVSWELAHGMPVPVGMVIDHLCRNKACVNPDHLEAVTQSENVRRGDLPKLTAARNRSRYNLN